MDIKVKNGTVSVMVGTGNFGDVPIVEDFEIGTQEYEITLSEKREGEYSDVALSYEEFESMVKSLNDILERLKDITEV